MEIVIIILTSTIIFGTIMLLIPTPDTTLSNWFEFHPNTHFSAQEFYTQVENTLKERQIPGATFKRTSFFENSLISDKREYLQITRLEYTFYICASQFGTGYFFSWWFEEAGQNLLFRLPILRTLFGTNRKNKRFHQVDSEQSYKSTVHNVVTETIKHMTEAAGIRN